MRANFNSCTCKDCILASSCECLIPTSSGCVVLEAELHNDTIQEIIMRCNDCGYEFSAGDRCPSCESDSTRNTEFDEEDGVDSTYVKELENMLGYIASVAYTEDYNNDPAVAKIRVILNSNGNVELDSTGKVIVKK
jgi:hypothetical protein